MDEKNETNQLARIENTKIVEIINQIPNLTDEDKHELTKQIASDDVEVRRKALDKISQSQLAEHDMNMILDAISAMDKEGIVYRGKKTIETGSGQFEIEIKGGDRKLIVPVMVILGVVLIAVLLILFWG